MMLVCVALVHLALARVPQAASDEAVLRGLVGEYYDAQTRKDPDKALSFWSLSANPRMSREGFVTLFGAGDARYTVGVQSVSIKDNEARVRVALAVERTILRDSVPTVIRQSLLNAELWRREGASWKLLREGSIAEELADDLLAAPAADRVAMTAGNSPDTNRALRYVLAQRASMMAAASGQYARAREIFELVLTLARATGDRRSESETLQNIANTYYFLKNYQDATVFYQQRLALSRDMDDDEAAAASLLGLATVAYARAEYTPALASYREALAIYEKRDDGPSIGRTLVSVGNVQYLQADYDAASASYRRAQVLLDAGMDLQGAGLARRGLARVFAAQGDVASALDIYGQVLLEARALMQRISTASTDVATALESIGELHFRLGNTDQARAAFDEARRLADRDPDASGRLFSSLGLTELVAGRFDAALSDYGDSRTRYELGKDPGGVARAWVGIGFSQSAREKFADAIAAYRTAIRIFGEQKDDEGSARAWLGLSLAQTGATDHAAALDSAQQVKTIADRIRSADLSWRANVRIGEALRKLTRLADARQSFQDAIVTIDRMAADVPTDPGVRTQLEDSAGAWAGLAFTLAAQGDAAGAVAAAEARRAHIRRVQLGPFQRDIARGATPEEQADEQAIVRDLISTRLQLRAERSAGRPDAARLARLDEQLTALVARRADQQSRLYARLPELQQWRGLGPSSVDDLNAIVPDRTLAIDYVLGDDEVLILTVAHGETAADVAATTFTGSRRELAANIAQAMQRPALEDAAEWRTRAAPLATALLTPIASRLDGRDRAIVVPDDMLWKVPFEALPVGDGILGAGAPVAYATSLATLALEQKIAASRAPQDRVAAGIVAAPAISAAMRAQLALTQQGWKEPDAEVTLDAAREIAAIYADGATLRAGAEATEAAARALIETSDVLHVSAPLLMSGPTPLFSSLLLGSAATDEQGAAADGRWEAREWFGASGRARVAVLTDGSSFGAAGVGGSMDAFAWAAAAAGIPALVVARWPADAFSSAGVLAAFHALTAKGSDPAEAWRTAVAAAREKSGGAPATWAGLRLIGAGGS